MSDHRSIRLGPGPDPKDLSILLAVASHELGPDRWTSVASRGVLYLAAGVSKTTWQTRGRRLIDAALLEQREPPAGASTRTGLRYRLTDAGREFVARHGPRTGHERATNGPRVQQGGEGGDSAPMSFSPREKDKSHSPDPGPVEPPRARAGHETGHERATRDDARALALGRWLLEGMALLGLLAPEDPQDRIEQETPEPTSVAHRDLKPENVTSPRSDGLRWDEQDQPELAQALEELRDQHSKRDGARAWQDSRHVEPAWCMRAYAHTVSRLLRGPEQGRRVRDAWGVYLATVSQLVERGGDAQSLDHAARFPDPGECFRQALEDLRRSVETRSLARVKAGLGLPVAEGPDVARLAAQVRAGGKLVGLPPRIGEDLARVLGRATLGAT